MTEEKTSFWVVRIGVRFWKLVMSSMISRPFVNVILQRQSLAKGKKQTDAKVGFEWSVRPEKWKH